MLTSHSASAEYGDTLPPMAAEKVYSIGELRKRILGLLGKADLVSFMGVEKACMADVAEALYHTVDFDMVWYSLSELTPNDLIYLDAVRVVNARAGHMSISPDMLEQLGPTASMEAMRTEPKMAYTDSFDDKLFHLVVPTLRSRCRNVRRIHFGSELGYQPLAESAWTVELDPSFPTSGHIEHTYTYEVYLKDEPPATFYRAPLPPSPSYTVRHSADVWAYPTHEVPVPRLIDRWLAAIREGPFFAGIYGGINLFDLPVTLELFECLYRCQAEFGNPGRLEDIRSQSIMFDIYEFERFAGVASSLTFLQLIPNMSGTHDEERTGISFRDLPTLTSIIRNDLPDLRHLRIAMNGIEYAEEFCQDLLGVDCLEDGGSIRRMTILVAQPEAPTSMFNILRCLSRLMASDGEITIAVPDVRWSAQNQEEYVKYLRKQPANRRRYLSVVDFSTLGVINPIDIFRLIYREDGQPERPIVSKSARWLEHLKTVAEISKFFISSHELAMANGIRVASNLQDLSTSATHAELLAEAEKMQDSVLVAKRAAESMSDLLSGIEETEMQEYIDSLRELMGRS